MPRIVFSNFIVMKRGIAIALSAAGMLFICLFTSFRIVSTAMIKPSDTAYYFSERGKLIRQDNQSLKGGYFVIRTRKKSEDLFSDVLRSDTTAVNGEKKYEPAAVKPISKKDAKRAKRLIEGKKFNDVTNYVFEILDIATLKKMYNNIRVKCNEKDSCTYREYGGVLTSQGILTLDSGDASDPRWFGGYLDLKIKKGDRVVYHSHPAGCEKVEDSTINNSSRYSTGNTHTLRFVENNEKKDYCFIQAPSKIDQHAVGSAVGYVFGMRSQCIYIFDSCGVKATLPFSFLRRRSIK